MPEYVITPQEPPTWRFEPADFLRRIQEQWPDARVGVSDSPDDPMATEALIPFNDSQDELGVALSNQGYAVYLDPAAPDTAAKFAVWFASQLPELSPTTYLFTTDFDVNVPLGPETTEEEILSLLGGA